MFGHCFVTFDEICLNNRFESSRDVPKVPKNKEFTMRMFQSFDCCLILIFTKEFSKRCPYLLIVLKQLGTFQSINKRFPGSKNSKIMAFGNFGLPKNKAKDFFDQN